MFKTVKNRVWAFDAEWIPDPVAGQMLYKLPAAMPNKEIMEAMWKEGGATEEDPTPYLKTVLCRIVSVAAVERYQTGSDVKLHLLSLPRDSQDAAQTDERSVVGIFLSKVGEYKPQLVGFNSAGADLKAMIQRSVVLGLSMPAFCKRPSKPWEGDDYFDSRNSEASVDLKDVVGGWGKATPSLNEIATLSGIPGKLDVDGEQVASLWLAGNLDKIIAYNEFDALTTYLLWLRIAHFGGHFTTGQYEHEQDLVRAMIATEIRENGKDHLQNYLDEWERLTEYLKQGQVAGHPVG
ncbi:MAG: 3'-5' exonuclease [Phycisphaerales bacterium]|nr:MAG: 3'-5' exonuclease [Phycisphaerales bacterium]